MRCWALLLLGCLTACDTAPRTVRLDLIPRGSCGRSSQTYDISCVAALELRVLDSFGDTLAEQCTPVVGSYTFMSDLVAAREITTLLESVDARDGVHLELRAYHAFDKQPCVDQTEADLMMWGSTGPIDFLTGNVLEVGLPFECRPSCDCAQFDASPAQCPGTLEPGVCTPLPAQRCRRECSSTAECFGGAPLTCEQQQCTAAAGEMCSECSSGADCDSGLCVENLGTGERFCARRCPPQGGVQVCPTFMACRAADGQTFTWVP